MERLRQFCRATVVHRNIFHSQAQTAQSVVLRVPWAGIWARHGNAVLGKIKAVSNGILREMERIRKKESENSNMYHLIHQIFQISK